MTTAEDRRIIRETYGLRALDQDGADQYIDRISLLTTLVTVCGLLERRHDKVSAIEYNGLLRIALRLRMELDLLHSPSDVNPGEETHWLAIVDGILDRSFFKPLTPYVDDCSDDSTNASVAAQSEGV